MKGLGDWVYRENQPHDAKLRTTAALLLILGLLAAPLAGCTQNTESPAPTAGGTDAAYLSSPPGPSASPAAAQTGVSISAYPALWRPAVSSAGGIRISAEDEAGAPLSGDWSATRGKFVLPPFRNSDGSISLPDQQPAKELKGLSEVEWLLPEDERGEGGNIEVRFSRGGQSTVLLFVWDSDMGLLSVGERFVAFSPDEISIIKEFSALVKGGRPISELLACSKENIGKLGNGLGPVLADGIVNRLESDRGQYSSGIEGIAEENYDALAGIGNGADYKSVEASVGKTLAGKLKPIYDNGYMVCFRDGEVFAGINWKAVEPAFAGKEGEELRQYIALIRREAEQPFVMEGALEISLDELAQRYIDARSYVQIYPLRTDWHFGVEQYRDAYLSSLLTLNGLLFSGDGFAVPQEHRAAFDGLISKYADDGLGKLLAEYKTLLEKGGWTLDQEIRDFLTAHGVPGY